MSADPAPPTPVVVVGASAGGVEALRDLASTLPPDLDACVLVVLHIPATGHSSLPAILDRAGPLAARHATDRDLLERGRILVAPPDRHLVVMDGRAALTRGPQENGHRPAVDVLFRSAARAAGPRVAAVVLSGSLDDGAAGAIAVAKRGGRLFVQDLEEALYDGMPRAAAVAVGDAVQAPVKKLAPLLAEWVGSLPDDTAREPSYLLEMETEMAGLDPAAIHMTDRPGRPAGFGCPDCNGSLYQIEEGGLVRFRCRVGHAWSPDSLLARQTIEMESALWMALRSLEEKSALNSDMHDRALTDGQTMSAARFSENADEARRAAELVRRLIAEIGGVAT